MNKILYISTISSVTHIPLLKALGVAGFDVSFIDYRRDPIQKIGHPLHSLTKILPSNIRNVIYSQFQDWNSNYILRKANEIKPDFIFIAKAKNINLNILDELRSIAPTINWYPDAANNWESIQRIACHYDYFFIFDRSIAQSLRGLGHNNVHYLPFCGDLDKSEDWPNVKNHKHQVVFLGSFHPKYYKDRLDILMTISDLGLEVWGNSEWSNTPLRNLYRGPVDPDIRLIKNIYQNSKIVIHIDSNKSNSGVSGLTLRPFDVTSAGSLLIAQDDRKEIFDLFEDDKEFVSFTGASDIRQKVEYYLGHEDERMHIARAGFMRTRDNHTYLDRVNELFRTVIQGR